MGQNLNTTQKNQLLDSWNGTGCVRLEGKRVAVTELNSPVVSSLIKAFEPRLEGPLDWGLELGGLVLLPMLAKDRVERPEAGLSDISLTEPRDSDRRRLEDPMPVWELKWLNKIKCREKHTHQVIQGMQKMFSHWET